jgi:hypothetical protein
MAIEANLKVKLTQYLQTGLEILDQDSNREKLDAKDTDPSVDGSIVPESKVLKLQLTINVAGLWRPKSEFNLQALELNEIEVVKAHLRDAMEEIQNLKVALESRDMDEIESLKKELESVKERAFLSLTSAAAASNQDTVQWNGTRGLLSESHFAISADTRTITIKKSGVYQIHCRLGQTNSANCQHLGLLVDGIEIAQCLQSDGHGYQNTAQITEVLEVDAGANLTVRCGANSNSIANQLQNRLNIVLLEQR